MNAFPSALVPRKPKKSAPGRTFRESQATCRISRALAAKAGVASTPRNTSLSGRRIVTVPGRPEWFGWLSTWFVAASGTRSSSSWLNPDFILPPCLPMWLRDLWCRCSELHGDPRAAPDSPSRHGRLIRCKAAANQNRVQPQSQACLRHLSHRLAGKIGHLYITAFIDGDCHRRRQASTLFKVCCRGLRGGLVRQSEKIRWGEVLQCRTIGNLLVLVRRLDETRADGHIARHVQIREHLFGNALENRGRYHASFVESDR